MSRHDSGETAYSARSGYGGRHSADPHHDKVRADAAALLAGAQFLRHHDSPPSCARPRVVRAADALGGAASLLAYPGPPGSAGGDAT